MLEDLKKAKDPEKPIEPKKNPQYVVRESQLIVEEPLDDAKSDLTFPTSESAKTKKTDTSANLAALQGTRETAAENDLNTTNPLDRTT